MGMELRQIRYFIAIAEDEHFGRASARLGIAQPALSRQMKLLEQELGFDLFERLPRGVRLTGAGKVFLAEMQELHSHLQRGIARAGAASRGMFGSLRLSMIESVAWHGLVPDALRIYRRRYPEVEIALSTMPTEQQLLRLRQGQTDVALVYNPAPAQLADLRSTEIARQTLVLAMPADSPLAGREEIGIRDLLGHKLVGFRRSASPRLYDDLQTALSSLEFTPNYISEPVNETEILALVSAGAGLAFTNASQVWRKPHGVVFARIRDLDVTMSLRVVYRDQDLSATRDRFLEVLRDVAGNGMADHPAQ